MRADGTITAVLLPLCLLVDFFLTGGPPRPRHLGLCAWATTQQDFFSTDWGRSYRHHYGDKAGTFDLIPFMLKLGCC